MLIILYIMLIGLLAGTDVLADGWTTSADLNLTVTENAYSSNWAGDEQGSFAWTFLSNSLAENQFSAKINLKNTLKLIYGQNYIQDRATGRWAEPVKLNDLIDYESVLRFSLGVYVDPYTAFRLKSQFIDKTNPRKKSYFDPVSLTESAGVARVFIKKDKQELIARLGAGIRQRIDRDKLDPETDISETDTALDGGFELVNDFRTTMVGDRINLTSKMTIFQAVLSSKAAKLKGKPEADYWKAPDVDLEAIWTAGITKYLMVTFYVQFLYDKEVDLKRRLKQSLSLGLTYKLI